MHDLDPVLLRTFARFSACSLALAAAVAVRAGDIVGRTIDANTGAYVPNVAVTAEPSGATAVSDSSGQFRIAGLSAGSYRLSANSVGYEAAGVNVTVGQTGDATADVSLASDVKVLSSFLVEGYREGRARALQEKRTAVNIMDTVSADSIGNLPDRNAAEALMRLPGLNATLDEGEGRYLSIRGVDPSLNQVMMDGATMAAPGGFRLGRAVSLDTIGAGQIAAIEVSKSVTPDMDANAVGGSINIKSTSAFDRRGRFMAGSLTAQRNGGIDKANPNPGGLGMRKTDGSAQFTFADTFGPGNTWGLTTSASYDRRSYQNDEMQIGGWTNTTIGGNQMYLPNGFELHPKWGDRQRKGLNFNFEYRPDAQTQFYVRPGYSNTDSREQRFEVLYSSSPGPTTTTLTSPRTGTYTTGTRSERRAINTAKNERLINVSAGARKTYGPFTLEPMLSRSTALSETPYTHSREFRNGNNQTGPIQFDLGDGFVPTRWDVNPAVDLPALYPLRRTRDDFGYTDERIWAGKMDVRWDSTDLLGHRGFLKTGIKALERTRISDQPSFRLVPVGTWNLGQTGAQYASFANYGGRFQSLFVPNSDAIDAFIAANPSLTQHDRVGEIDNSVADNYRIREDIYAGYAMGSITLNQLTVLAGLRWEQTDATIKASQERTVAGLAVPQVIPTTGTKNFSNFFPNVQAKYRFTDQFQLRAAYTQTIGRPAYEDSRPLATLNYSSLPVPANPSFPNTGSVTTGNPAIKPWYSRNYDISLEWYARKGGAVVSVAGFRKDISNPIYSFTETQRNVIYSGLGFDQLVLNERRNGTSGRVSGLEFNVYQPFRFLPSPFDGFGVDANLTTISSREVIPTRPGEDIPFFRQPSAIRNLTLFYEKHGLSARVAYSYSSEQIYSLGGSLIQDQYKTNRGQYDGQVRYRVTKNYSLTFAVNNITREPDNMSYGFKNLLRLSRLLDRSYRLSVDFNF